MSREASNNILVKNIYYMMAYSFGAIEINDFRRLGTETFYGVSDLMAAILICGLSSQRKRGFEKAYMVRSDDLTEPRGQINCLDTFRLRSQNSNRISCQYDEYFENTYRNQILKHTAKVLLGADIPKSRKCKLKQCVISMGAVEDLCSSRVEWSRLQNERMSPSYRMLMNVCYMVHNDLLMTDTEGKVFFADVFDAERFSKLYETFLLKYFKRHHPDLSPNADTIDACVCGERPSFLPEMLTDVTLHAPGKVLIIDAKCYGKILNLHFDVERMSSEHRYQIYSYVMHRRYEKEDAVSGMLLYAQTKNEDSIDEIWNETGCEFSCKTLDLDCDFEQISQSLDAIAVAFRNS